MGKHATHPELLAFGQRLKEALASVGLTDPALVGQLLANAQEYPERTQPYASCVVDAWLNGEALPTPEIFSLFYDLLEDVPQLEQLEESYDSALLSSHPLQLSESILLLRHHIAHDLDSDGQSWTYKKFSTALKAAGYPAGDAPAVSETTLHYWLKGANGMPAEAMRCADIALGLEGTPDAISNCLETKFLFARQGYLQDAAVSHSFRKALQAMRQACGFSLKDMCREIASITGVPLSSPALSWWEHHSPQKTLAHLPSRSHFPGTDVLTVYGQILEQQGMGEWFKAHETHLRALLNQELRVRSAQSRDMASVKEESVTSPSGSLFSL